VTCDGGRASRTASWSSVSRRLALRVLSGCPELGGTEADQRQRAAPRPGRLPPAFGL